jgi:hypothetical protein
MIKWLVLVWPYFRRDRLVPFFGIAEDRIDIENDAAERKQPVPHHLADLIFGVANFVYGSGHLATCLALLRVATMQ